MAKKQRPKPAAGKTPFHAVVEKVQRGTITDDEIKRYFVVNPNPRQPFAFTIGVNRGAVGLDAVEKTGKLADALVHDASIGRDQRVRAAKPPTGYKRKTPLVAEGDSWFRLPPVIMPETLIDHLQQDDGYPFDNLAHWGDTLADMIQRGAFWDDLKQDDTFLFSAGGNDVLGGEGGLAPFLNQYDVDHNNVSDAPYYVRQEFYDNLKLILQNYEGLIQSVHQQRPQVIMLGHGYDYVIPINDGPWLGSGLGFRGLSPGFNADLCQAIIKIMIDAFNSGLSRFQKVYPNYRYVDLRGAIGKDQWHDELHPTSEGSANTAARFDKALRALPASGTFSAPLVASHLFGHAA